MATTTNYGWSIPAATDYVKDGYAAIDTLGQAIDTTEAGRNLAGLVLIKTQTIGTTVSSVTVTNAFSTTYDNYRIIIVGGTQSASGSISCSLGGITTGYYSLLQYATFTTTTPAGAGNSNTSSWAWAGGGNATAAMADFEIFNPFATRHKFGKATYIQMSSTGQAGSTYWINGSTASATDLVVTPSIGTFTGGTIYVYGYRKAV